jgi:hypothetical protein
MLPVMMLHGRLQTGDGRSEGALLLFCGEQRLGRLSTVPSRILLSRSSGAIQRPRKAHVLLLQILDPATHGWIVSNIRKCCGYFGLGGCQRILHAQEARVVGGSEADFDGRRFALEGGGKVPPRRPALLLEARSINAESVFSLEQGRGFRPNLVGLDPQRLCQICELRSGEVERFALRRRAGGGSQIDHGYVGYKWSFCQTALFCLLSAVRARLKRGERGT